MNATTAQRTIVALEGAIGIGATLAPDKLIAAYGMKPEDLNGIGAFAFRLFGIRNVAVAVANARGEQWASDLTLQLQLPDALMFAHAFRTGYVPKQAAAGALATAGLITALSFVAKRG